MTQVLSGDALTYWRWHRQFPLGHLVVWVPERVVQRRVNQASFSYPVSVLTVDNPDGDTGDLADVEISMMIKVSDSSGNEKGWTRAHKNATTNTIYIHPTGRGDIDFADDDIIEVYDHYVPYALIPYIDPTGILYKDYDLLFSDQTDNFPPVANAGPARAGRVDPDTGLLRVTLNASSSFAVAAGASISTYLWDIKDCTLVSGPLTAASITIDVPPGQRWVKVTVTDSNSATAVARVPIYAEDGHNYISYPCRLARRAYNAHVEGWEGTFDLYGADVSQFPEHALLIYWEDEYFGTHNGSLNGYTGAEHIKFVGYNTHELVYLEPYQSQTTVNGRSVRSLLGRRPAFPQTARRDATPATWGEVADLDWWRMIIYLLMFHSNVLELCDLEKPDFAGNYPVVRLDTDAGSLASQIDYLARGVCARLTCDRQGKLLLRRIPHLMSDSERASFDPIVEITAADILADPGPHFERPGWDEVAWLEATAIDSDTSTITPLMAISPGTTPGQGLNIGRFDNLLAQNQTELNLWTGHEYARRNSRRDGKRVVRQGTLTLAHRGDVIDPAWQRPFTLTLPASSNNRGLAFSADRMIPMVVDVAYDHTKLTSTDRLQFEAECKGAPAETVEVQGETIADQPVAEYQDIIVVDNTYSSDLPSAPNLVYIADEAYVWRCENFTDATPSFDTVLNVSGLVGGGYYLRDFMVDSLSPRTKAQMVCTNGTYTKLYGTTNLSDSSPTWSLLQTWTHNCERAYLVSSNQEFSGANAWFLMVQISGSTGCKVYHSHDWWSNVTTVDPDTSWVSGSKYGFALSLNWASASSGVVLCASGTGSNPRVKKSTNGGASFGTTITAFDNNNYYYSPHGILIPWIEDPNEQKLYVVGGSSSSVDAYVKYTDDGGSTFDDITPTYSGNLYGGGRRNDRTREILHAYVNDTNPQRLALIGAISDDNGGSGQNQRFFVTDDRGDDGWTMKHEFSTEDAYVVGGWPYDPDIFFISCSNKLLYTNDAGATMTSKTPVGYSQGVRCVPIWI